MHPFLSIIGEIVGTTSIGSYETSIYSQANQEKVLAELWHI